MTRNRTGRRIIRTRSEALQVYDLDGKLQPEIGFLPLNYNRDAGRGVYMMRMEPGAETSEHAHRCVEDFMVLEGHLIDDDGTVFGPGDHVSYAPGTRHHSRTEDGCLLIVFEWEDGPE